MTLQIEKRLHKPDSSTPKSIMKPKSRNPFLSAPRLSLPFASAIAAMAVLAATPATRAATWNKLIAGPFS